ncbi:hypothetical protein [Chlorogloea sp. CCALA 695]|uniref:hypothetical protein n=1 Tax=Chlorogloea sp. CCALA 695 TaxID=2107693 RepID=UPI0018EC02EC|nr:hypothetical protein [Chlorogloea sp. CCALA 695]
MSDRTQLLRKRIAQLETELRAVRKQAQAQRQRIAQKCGHEFLALVDSDRNCKVVMVDIVQKLVFQDERRVKSGIALTRYEKHFTRPARRFRSIGG